MEHRDLYFFLTKITQLLLCLEKSVRCVEYKRVCVCGIAAVVMKTLSKITLHFLIRCPRNAWHWRKQTVVDEWMWGPWIIDRGGKRRIKPMSALPGSIIWGMCFKVVGPKPLRCLENFNLKECLRATKLPYNCNWYVDIFKVLGPDPSLFAPKLGFEVFFYKASLGRNVLFFISLSFLGKWQILKTLLTEER